MSVARGWHRNKIPDAKNKRTQENKITSFWDFCFNCMKCERIPEHLLGVFNFIILWVRAYACNNSRSLSLFCSCLKSHTSYIKHKWWTYVAFVMNAIRFEMKTALIISPKFGGLFLSKIRRFRCVCACESDNMLVHGHKHFLLDGWYIQHTTFRSKHAHHHATTDKAYDVVDITALCYFCISESNSIPISAIYYFSFVACLRFSTWNNV